MSSDVVLSVNKISKRYEIYDKPVKRLWQMLCAGHRIFFREFWAIRDVSFDIRRGESWGIVGRNGAGKSTLLKIITGVLQPTNGKVETRGKIAALLELGSGFNPEFTGRENVYLNASILGLSRKDVNRRYQEIIDFADIGDFIDQPVKKYSSGMKVRLAFAVQIMVRPDILIVDEALAVGDMFFQNKCMTRLRKLREQGTTLLFVSHSLGTVRSLCDKAIYLKDGCVEMIGDAKEVCERYQLSEIAKRDGQVQAAPAGVPQDPPPQTSAVPKKGPDAAGFSFKPLFRIDKNLSLHCSERRGTKEVEITSADFYDKDNRRVSEVESGDMVRYVISFKVNRDIPAGAVSTMGCRNKLGEVVLGYKSAASNHYLPALKAGSRCTLDFEFTVPLLRGQYFWSACIMPDVYDLERRYDLCLGIAPLRVVEKKTPEFEFQWGFCRTEVTATEFRIHGTGR